MSSRPPWRSSVRPDERRPLHRPAAPADDAQASVHFHPAAGERPAGGREHDGVRRAVDELDDQDDRSVVRINAWNGRPPGRPDLRFLSIGLHQRDEGRKQPLFAAAAGQRITQLSRVSRFIAGGRAVKKDDLVHFRSEVPEPQAYSFLAGRAVDAFGKAPLHLPIVWRRSGALDIFQPRIADREPGSLRVRAERNVGSGQSPALLAAEAEPPDEDLVAWPMEAAPVAAAPGDAKDIDSVTQAGLCFDKCQQPAVFARLRIDVRARDFDSLETGQGLEEHGLAAPIRPLRDFVHDHRIFRYRRDRPLVAVRPGGGEFRISQFGGQVKPEPEHPDVEPVKVSVPGVAAEVHIGGRALGGAAVFEPGQTIAGEKVRRGRTRRGLAPAGDDLPNSAGERLGIGFGDLPAEPLRRVAVRPVGGERQTLVPGVAESLGDRPGVGALHEGEVSGASGVSDVDGGPIEHRQAAGDIKARGEPGEIAIQVPLIIRRRKPPAARPCRTGCRSSRANSPARPRHRSRRGRYGS